jgi:hypothetical protein
MDETREITPHCWCWENAELPCCNCGDDGDGFGDTWLCKATEGRCSNDPATRIAQHFHRTYEALAPTFGYQTRPESAVAWADVPDQNRALMVAVVADLMSRGVIRE